MKTAIPEQTIIQRIQPECDTLHIKMKEAKETQHKTNQGLSDSTGIPLSNIGKFFSGFITNPNAHYVAALCIDMGLSLDKLFGIPTETAGADAAARIRELEAEIHDLNIHFDYTKKERDNLISVAKLRARVITGLLAISVLMTIFIIIYMIIDVNNPNTGLFQADYKNPFGFVIIASIVLSFAAIIAFLIVKLIKKQRTDKNE